MLKYLILIVILLLFVESCVSRIEDRCVNNGLQINSLQIEDTGTFSSHAKVSCGK